MTNQFDKLVRQLENPIFTDSDAAILLSVGALSRHGIIKRAIAKNDLIRLRRGLYLLAPHLANRIVHPFEIAQRIYGPSYVSLESALSYHQLIPEAVYTVTSAATKRKKNVDTPIGRFSYNTLPQKNFHIDVSRVNEHSSGFFIANPWKALCDYVYVHRKDWVGLGAIAGSLRIEVTELPELDVVLAKNLIGYYKSRRIRQFINSIVGEKQ